MKINGESLHCRIYRSWYRDKYRDEPLRSNLCPYMRAVMFWAPLRAIFGGWIKIWRIPLGAITIPALLLSVPFLVGNFSYNGKMGLWFAYAMATAIVSITIGIGTLIEKGHAGRAGAAVARWSFWRLLGAYFRSAHDRVCPEVDWK